MISLNATNFRKNLYDYLDQTISFDELITVTTKNGNAVIMSEQDYRDLMETVSIYSNPKYHEELLRLKNASENEFVSEDEVDW